MESPLLKLYEREQAADRAARNRPGLEYESLMASTVAQLKVELDEFRALDHKEILRISEAILRDFPQSEHAPRYVREVVDGLRGIAISAKVFINRREAQLNGLIDRIKKAEVGAYAVSSVVDCDKRAAACLLGGSKAYAGDGFINSVKDLIRAVEDAVARAGVRGVGPKSSSSTGYIKQPRSDDDAGVDSYWSVFDDK